MIVRKATPIDRKPIRVFLQCPHCGIEVIDTGYDDDLWWSRTLTYMPCPACEKTNAMPTEWVKPEDF